MKEKVWKNAYDFIEELQEKAIKEELQQKAGELLSKITRNNVPHSEEIKLVKDFLKSIPNYFSNGAVYEEITCSKITLRDLEEAGF